MSSSKSTRPPKRRKRRKSRAKMASGLPKGAYRHPEGGIAMSPLSRTYVDGNGKTRTVTIQAVRREKPDLQRLARALVQLAREEIAAEKREQSKK